MLNHSAASTAVLALCLALASTGCSAPAPLGEAASELGGPPPVSSADGGAGASADTIPTTSVPAPGTVAKLDYQNPTIRAISSPENVTSLATPGYSQGRIRSTHAFYSAPLFDAVGIFVSNMGGPCAGGGFSVTGCYQLTFATGFNSNWAAGAFTGFVPPSALFQFGYRDLSEPATLETAPNAYQLHGVDAGILLASRSFEHVYDFGANPHADFAIRYGDPVTPFRHDTSELTMQALVRVPTSAPSGGGAGQIAFVVSLRDTTTGEGVTFVAKIWDSRPASGGALDAMGDRANNVTTVRTSLAAGARYATVSPFSNVTRHEQPWSSLDFFRVHFSGAQLADVARTIRAATGLNVSTKASDWVLTTAGLRQEVIVGTSGGREMLLGASYRELAVYEFY